MIFFAQIDIASKTLEQGLGFSDAVFAESHMTTQTGKMFISTDGFVSPATHKYEDGKVVAK